MTRKQSSLGCKIVHVALPAINPPIYIAINSASDASPAKTHRIPSFAHTLYYYRVPVCKHAFLLAISLSPGAYTSFMKPIPYDSAFITLAESRCVAAIAPCIRDWREGGNEVMCRDEAAANYSRK